MFLNNQLRLNSNRPISEVENKKTKAWFRIMTKEQKLINVQKQFTNLNAYKTYEQFVSEEVSLNNQQNLYPELGYEDVGSSKGHGPCDTCRKDTQ